MSKEGATGGFSVSKGVVRSVPVRRALRQPVVRALRGVFHHIFDRPWRVCVAANNNLEAVEHVVHPVLGQFRLCPLAAGRRDT